MNHVEWLNRYFNIIAQLVCGSQNGEDYSGLIGAHCDKGDGYADTWEEMGLDFNHAMCLYLLSHCKPYDAQVKATHYNDEMNREMVWFKNAVHMTVCGNWNVLDLIRWIELNNPYFIGSLGEVRDIHSHVGKCLYYGKITRYLVMSGKLMYEVAPDIQASKDACPIEDYQKTDFTKLTTMYLELCTDRTLSKQHSFYCGM
jgi:hypothetical protein